MRSVVAERGQVTIPKKLREQLGIRPGTVMNFTAENGRLVAVKDRESDAVGKVFGCLGNGINSDALIAELRGEQ